MKKYVLFDLDGTLTESGPGIIAGVRHALEAQGIREDDDAALMRFVGPPLTDSFKRFYGMNDEDANQALADYRAYYNDKGVYENAPYPGVKEMLQTLSDAGPSLAIASSKPQNMVDIVLNHFDLQRFFDFTVCGEDSGALFTKTGVIEKALQLFAERDHLSLPELLPQAVMVGDRKHDIEGAKNNKIASVGVRWGYAPDGELEEAGADEIVKDAAALAKLLTSP